MSRGFVREGDQEEVPMVPQRAFLPAGDRYPALGFEFWGLGEYCAMWTSTMENVNYAFYREMYNDSEQIYREGTNKKFSFSVRCIKD
jgi:uncharacterized protein (TIGR02145 family)